MSYDYSEDQLIQKSTADLLENELGWKSVYAFDKEVLGPIGTLGRNTRRGGCSTALWRICNPTQLNIRICNPQKKYYRIDSWRITNPDNNKCRIANPT